VQVAELDNIVVRDPQSPHPSSREVEKNRGPQASGSDNEDRVAAESTLPCGDGRRSIVSDNLNTQYNSI
jgi:hypothetical protein